MKKLLLSIVLLSISYISLAQLITPFTIRFGVTQKGGITMIGNAAAGCGATSGNGSCLSHACTTAHAEAAPNGVGVDNDFVQNYVDIDADAATFMSSSDSLALPNCSLISFAGLYWAAGGETGAPDGSHWATRASCKLKVNNGAYTTLTATGANQYNNNQGYKSYHNFVNITSIVQAAGRNARYTVADMPLLNDNTAGNTGNSVNRWGGWAIVIVYRNDLMSMRNLTVFNGLTNVSSPGNTVTDIPLSGFLTPPTGPVRLELGLVAFDGDRGAVIQSCSSNFKGDSLLFNGAGTFKPISDALHPQNDVFNSTISNNGVMNPYRNPLYGNTLGHDVNIFVPDNTAKLYIGNNATSCTIRQKTGGETYLTQVVTSTIDVFEPDDRGGLSVVDLNGGTVVAGDTLEYTASIKNIGSNPSINTYIVDTFPINCIYVPGSMNITFGPNAGVKTDNLGDDQGEYFSAAKSLRIRIGTGATNVAGGTILNSPTGADSTQIKFRVVVTSDCIVLLCAGTVANRFRIYGTGFFSGYGYNTGSNPTIFDSGGCPIQGTTDTPISTIACQPPTATTNSPVCAGGTINLFVQSSPDATYSWTGPNGFASAVQNPVIPNATAAMAGAYTVTVLVNGTSCVYTATSTAVVVNPSPVMSSSATATICSGGTVNIPLTSNLPGTFTWIAADNINVTGESTTLQTTSTLNNTLINTSTVPQTVTYSVTPIATLGTCSGATQTVTVTVNPTPSITSASTATICSGTTLNIPLTATVPSTFTWIATNNPNTTGESTTLQNTSTINNTLINTTGAVETVTYTVTPTATIGGCGSTAQQILTVTVNPTATVTSSASATICSGGTVNIPLTSSLAGTFTWIATNNTNTTGESLTLQSTSTINNTIVNTSTIPQTVNYTVTPITTVGGCSGATQTVSVLVNPLPVMTSANAMTICSGAALNLPLTSATPSTFTWIAGDNANTTGESLTTQNTSTINDTIINNSAVPQTVTYTVTPTATAGACVGATQTVTVTVNPTPTITSSSTATVCSGVQLAIGLTSSVPSTFTWIAGNNANTTGESLTLQNSSTINNTIINNTTVPQTVTYTVTPTATSGGCIGTANQTVTVTVNPAPNVTSANTATICSGSAVNIPLTSSVPSAFTWIAADNLNVTGESLTLQSTSTLNNTLVNSTSVPQTVVYTVTPTASTGGCAGVPQTVTVIVNPLPIITSPATATICSGQALNIPLTANVPSTFTWIATDNLNTTGESTTLQSTSTINNTIINNTGFVQVVTYTVTPTATSGGCGNAAQQIVTVTVNPLPTTTSSSSATICSGGTVNILLTSSQPGTFTWVAADNTNTTGESLTIQNSSTLNNTIINTSTIPQTVNYSVIVTATVGGCSAATQTVAVLVNPGPVMTSQTSATICSGQTVSIPLTANPGSTFTWVAADNANTTGESLTNQNSSTLSNTIINTSAVPQTVAYTVTPTATVGGCIGAPQTVNVTVNPTPVITLNSNNVTVCSGIQLNIPLSANVPSSFTWIAANNPNTTGESTTLQNSATINNTIINNTAGPQTVIYTVNATATAGGCGNTSPQTITVTVNPSPTLTSSNTATICSGSTLNIPLTSSIPSTFTWIAADNNNTTGESLTLQSTALINNTIINSSLVPQTVTYTVTPTAVSGGCASVLPQIVTVTVNPLDDAAFSYATSTFCQTGTNPTPTITGTLGGTFTSTPAGLVINPATGTVTLASSTLGTYTVTYTTNGICPSSATASITITTSPTSTFTYSGGSFCHGGTNPLPIFNPPASGGVFTSVPAGLVINSTTGEIDLTLSPVGVYTVTNTIAAAGGCSSSTSSVSVTINPNATVSAGADATVCLSGSYTLSGTFGGGAGGVTWSTSGSGTFNNPSLAGAIYTPSAGDIAAGTVTLTITTNDPAGPCPSVSDNMVLTITTAPTVSAGPDVDMCTASPVVLAGTFGGSATSITWTTGGTGTFNDATLPGATYTPSAADIAAGTVTLTITTDDPAGPCGAVSDNVNITVYLSPTVSAGADTAICLSSNYQLSGSFGGSANGITWSTNGSGTFDNTALTNATYTPSAADIATGSVTLTIITNDPTGPCVPAFDNMLLTITTGVPVSAGPNDTICERTNYTLSGSFGGGASSITWTTSGTGTFTPNNTVTNPVYHPSPADVVSQNVVLTITTNDPPGPCGAGTDFMLLHISPAAIVSANHNDTICSGTTYTMLGSYGGSATSVTWTTSGTGTFNNPASPGAIYTPSAADIAAGGVNLTLTTNDPPGPCPALLDVMYLGISPAVVISAGPDDVMCSNTLYTTQGSFSGGATSVLWTTSGTGTFNNPTLATPVYTPSAADISNSVVVLTITSNDPYGPCPALSDAMNLTINPATTSNAGADATICATSQITLSGSVGGGATNMTWTTSGTGTFDNTTIGNATYTPSAADDANLSVTLYLTTNDPPGVCGPVTDTILITITPRDAAGFGYADSVYCQSGVNPTPTVTGLPGGTFIPSSPGLVVNPTTGEITLLSSSVGTYTVMYLTNGPCPDSTYANITITPLFIATFSYAGNLFCENGSPNPVPVYVPGGSGETFTFHPAGLVINPNTGEVDLIASTPGTYTVINTILPQQGCALAVDSTTITITPLDNATITYPLPLYCANGTNPIPTITGLPGGVFTSTLGGSINSSTGEITLPVTPGVYNVTYTTNGACPNADTVPVTITAPPISDAGPLQNLGCGDSLQLNGTNSSSGPNFTYLWSTGGGNIVSGGGTPTATVNQAGVYTLLVTDLTTGCTQTDTVSVIDLPPPVASFTYSPNPATGHVPLTVTFTNTSTNANTYFWVFGDGTTSTLQDPTHTFVSIGVFAVVLYVTNNGHCVDSTEILVVTYPTYAIIVPNVFTPNNDQINDLFFINTTGVAEINCYIYDRWGLKLYEWHTLEGGWDGRNANGKEAPDGTYFYIYDLKDADNGEHADHGSFMLIRQ